MNGATDTGSTTPTNCGPPLPTPPPRTDPLLNGSLAPTATAHELAVPRPSLSGPPTSYVSSEGDPSPPFVAANYAHDGKKHLLLCASGSVATIKLPKICHALGSTGRVAIRVVLTASAAKFLAGQASEQPTVRSLLEIPGVEAVYRDEDEWARPWTRNAPILHIEIRRWADICVVAPMSANTLSKMVHGLADNLLTSVLRCWDTEDSIEHRGRSVEGGLRKRVVVAPAMNTGMWQHPVTDKQIRVLVEEWGVGVKGRKPGSGWVEVLKPSTRQLACGDTGIGAMVGWDEVVQVIRNRLYLGIETQR